MARHNAISELIAAYAALLPVMPLLQKACAAEIAAPGYGADAIFFRMLQAQIRDDHG